MGNDRQRTGLGEELVFENSQPGTVAQSITKSSLFILLPNLQRRARNYCTIAKQKLM